MTKAKRYIVTQLLHAQGAMLVHIHHEMYRVMKVEKDGLTDKEIEYMKKTLDDLTRVRDRITKFAAHLRKST